MDGVGASPRYPIESVDRALRALLMFQYGNELRLSTVRDELAIGQSTARRLMAMLVYRGFAEQDPVSRSYSAGPALTKVGVLVASRESLPFLARPILDRLADETGETVHLGVLEGSEVRFVDCVESKQALRVTGRVGRVLPAHATSIGKAMLASLADEVVTTLYPDSELVAVTRQTKRDRSSLLTELGSVRKRGYATSNQESENGVCSVGVAVRYSSLGLTAGLSVAAPTARTSTGRLGELGVLLAEYVEPLRSQLSF